MKIGVLKEIHVGEKRVASTPEVVEKLIKLGFELIVESGAGAGANFSDQAYERAGAKFSKNAEATWSASDLVIKVRPPEQNPQLGKHEIDLMPDNCQLISFLWPAQNEKKPANEIGAEGYYNDKLHQQGRHFGPGIRAGGKALQGFDLNKKRIYPPRIHSC